MNKNSFLLLEMVLSIVILSFVGVYFYRYISEIYIQNQQTTQINISQIQLQSTQIFIKNKLINGENIESFYLSNGILYYKGKVLLIDVDMFEINYLNSKIIIDIAIANNKIVQKWVL